MNLGHLIGSFSLKSTILSSLFQTSQQDTQSLSKTTQLWLQCSPKPSHSNPSDSWSRQNPWRDRSRLDGPHPQSRTRSRSSGQLLVLSLCRARRFQWGREGHTSCRVGGPGCERWRLKGWEGDEGAGWRRRWKGHAQRQGKRWFWMWKLAEERLHW